MTFIATGITLIGTGFALLVSLPTLAEKAALAMIGCGFTACGWMLVWLGSLSRRSRP